MDIPSHHALWSARMASHVTQMLEAVERGDHHAAETLLPLVYDELHELARSRMARLAPGQTLQPTALVHEVYLRLVGEGDPGWENRAHFFFAAARAMQNLLVEQARRKASLKRGGDRKHVPGEDLAIAIDAPPEELIALDEALAQLEQEDPRQHQVVLLRYFGGFAAQDIATMLDVSLSTVERAWRVSRARLHQLLTESSGKEAGSDEGSASPFST